MSDQPTRRRALIVSDFTDAGTGESFTAGAEPMIEAGAFANYEAAGLVTTPTPRAAAKPASTPRRKRAGAKPATTPLADMKPDMREPVTPSHASEPAA